MVKLHTYIALATLFVSAFTLFFLFYNINQLSVQCKTNPSLSPLCTQLTGLSTSMLVILLIIGGFVITITATAYIMLGIG